MEETTKILSQDIWFPSQASSLGLTEYKVEVLTTQP